MRKTNKFIFVCIIAVILFAPVFYGNILAAEGNMEHSAKAIEHGEDVTENTVKSIAEGHEAEAATQGAEVIEHAEEHGSSPIWPYYGKMVIFAEIMLAFMIFSFIAPLAHFYIKGEKHH